MTQNISRITSVLVAGLAALSFILSYAALRSVAAENGVVGTLLFDYVELSYLWPWLVDGALVVFSLAIVRATLLAENTLWPWSLVIGYSSLTLVFNIIHAQPTWTGWLVAAMPPLTLVLSFETFMNMTKSGVQRKEITDSLATIIEQFTEMQNQRDNLTGQLEALDRQVRDKKEELNQLQITTRVFLPDNPTIEQRRSIVKQMDKMGYSNNEMGEYLSVHPNTIKNDKAAIRQNGHG